MTVRLAGVEDIPDVIVWGRRFFDYSPWAEHTEFDPESLSASLAALIHNVDGAVFLADGGIIGGLVFPLYFNARYRVAQELFWFAPERDGEALREAFEAWARERGADAIQFSCLADDRERAVRRLYGRAGYRPTEVSLLREIA